MVGAVVASVAATRSSAEGAPVETSGPVASARPEALSSSSSGGGLLSGILGPNTKKQQEERIQQLEAEVSSLREELDQKLLECEEVHIREYEAKQEEKAAHSSEMREMQTGFEKERRDVERSFLIKTEGLEEALEETLKGLQECPFGVWMAVR